MVASGKASPPPPLGPAVAGIDASRRGDIGL
jgi:hypothetical protein